MKKMLYILAITLFAQGAFAADCCEVTLEPETPLASDSIYQLNSTWTAQDGSTVHLADMRGCIRVVAMVYTTCAHACPMMAQEMKQIKEQLPADSHVAFSFFSFDPERDTPEALRNFATRNILEGADWSLFTGNPDDIRELAAVLGVNYRKELDGEIAHSNQITALDKEGRIVYQTIGLTGKSNTVVTHIKNMLASSESESETDA